MRKRLRPLAEDPVRQQTTSGFSPQVGLSFEGLGNGQYNFWVEDRTASGNGVEARVPFLDHRIVEFARHGRP